MNQKKQQNTFGLKKKSEDFENQEIKSHSSMINNQIIGNLFATAAEQNKNIGSLTQQSLTLPNLRSFFSTVRAIYDECWMIIDPDTNKQIVKLRDRIYNDILSDWNNQDGNNIWDVLITLFFKIEKMYGMIKSSLQNYQFFFRIESQESADFSKSDIFGEGENVFKRDK